MTEKSSIEKLNCLLDELLLFSYTKCEVRKCWTSSKVQGVVINSDPSFQLAVTTWSDLDGSNLKKNRKSP